jgi:uncharacterized protein YeaO (DUF488 family)
MIRIKRAYEPAAPRDGKRFLVDRLWPRGKKKGDLRLDEWLKDIAPSAALCKWFGHDPARWQEFCSSYFAELERNPEAWEPLVRVAKKGTVTLVFAARDPEHNNAVALSQYLSRKLRL